MKKNIQYAILTAEALLCVVLAVVPVLSANVFSGMLAFPFEQIGLALRALSLSGVIGNLVAIVLYVGICLSPAAFFYFRKNRKYYAEDALPVLLSLLLFFVLYWMINPGAITLAGSFAGGLPVAKAILGVMVDSVLLGYLILRLLRLFYASDVHAVQRYLTGLLFLLNLLFVAVIFGGGVHKAVQSIQTMQTANSGNTHLFGINYLFTALGFVVENLPYALNIVIVFLGMSLLEELGHDRYGETTVNCANKLSKICGIALSVVVAVGVTFPVLQLLFAQQLFSLNAVIQLPLFSIVFVLLCLLFTKLVQENKALKDENDSII